MILRIFSSSRKIKEYQEKAKAKNALLDSAFLVSDFLDRVCVVNSFKASSYESLLLMQEACLKSKDLEKKLGISAEFFAFLKNNEYLFSFFKELSLEKKSIQDPKNNDYYATYNEHLEILDEVYTNYLLLLKQHNLYDDLSLAQEYKLNLDFLNEYEGIYYDLQGFLSKFEEDLLCEISKIKSTIISFKTSKFNLEYLLELDFLKDIHLELDMFYEVNLSQKKILKQEKLSNPNTLIKLKAFELRSLQCAFVMDEISNFVRAGIDPEKIAVITPDESFCELLKLFDKNNMLNFASGVSIKESLFYQKIKALYNGANSDAFIYKIDENYFEQEKMIFDYHNTLLHYLELQFEDFRTRFDQICDLQYFENLIHSFLKDESQELMNLVQKELCFIKDLLKNKSLKLKELMQLFFMQLDQIKLSYVGGGKVTVMGLLESRGLSFDGVVILDFNEDFVPKRSINELFLNNEVRKKAGLISYERRENLQRLYYENLIKNAKKLSISFVENEEQTRSRFLDELDFNFFEEKTTPSKAYLNALKLGYQGVRLNLNPIKAPVLKHDIFEKELSFSRLNLFLNQKRTYFYRYILELPEPRALSDESKAKNQGNFIHKMLELYYKNYSKNNFNLKIFNDLLEQEYQKYSISELELEIFKLKFIQFAENEKEHFKLGYKVIEQEEEHYKALNIQNHTIRLKGIIDRIDKLEDKHFIIDYKSGKVPSKSFQLAFYKALYDENAETKFYDLNQMQFVEEKAKSLDELKECLKDLLEQREEEIEFENDKDEYCPYKIIYKKDFR
ncbi:PD-(D/E)XK nuclease family protein [Campylobacter coli]|nr:PD-(D/E)XK nuclease family protein [Campylobacter coli]EJS2448030.1 PD-(D/E)XK nuclease family protein [Campylobacter coli]EJY3900752.1 PD-(D/E)XK nuclease family protein [Campylobacter coli]EKF8733573.1 PD-(D/E)XK nuclease family protein [Campylobacter coli]EKK2553982.1 PD-(D/E)XK nuclease family protein [Campylobacter coli]